MTLGFVSVPVPPPPGVTDTRVIELWRRQSALIARGDSILTETEAAGSQFMDHGVFSSFLEEMKAIGKEASDALDCMEGSENIATTLGIAKFMDESLAFFENYRCNEPGCPGCNPTGKVH